jgi:hypothetical protein
MAGRVCHFSGLAIIGVLIALFTQTIGADPIGDCSANHRLWLGEYEMGTGSPQHTFYLDERDPVFGDGIWIYQESNGIFSGSGDPIQDLQRGGIESLPPHDAETCTDAGPWAPDSLLYG